MAVVDLIMPKLGESIMEATILKWMKQPGDTVEMDETVLEIATDKVDSEVPSTAAGVIEEILFNVNDVVPIGTVIARIKTGAAETSAPKTVVSAPMQEVVSSQPDQVAEVVETIKRPAAAQAQPTNGATNRFYSPLVLNIAASEGVSMVDLENIPGTGNEGRVTKKDILQFVSERKSGKASSNELRVSSRENVSVTNESPKLAAHNSQLTTYSGNVEIIEMDRMRKLIADHMVRSKHTSPHVTSFTEADVTNMVMWRNKVKKDFEKREGTKITFTPLFIEAVVRCIKKFPLINCSLDGNNIIIKKDINIGMATALPSGNLIVPVIKNADQLNLVGLAKQVNGLADAARNGKLKVDDTTGGTFTMTNVGTFGSLMGTPIINQPQVAILAVGAIKKRPVVIESPSGDSIAIRHMMYLSMSYDHRIVDGSLGATFLTAVAKEMENFDGDREY
ncbi:MAG: 2-oxo acid dehydrogenase subunit E2 [Chitinophagaceae bacterium]|nr:2-oxo acid dehydrogenase subunit E2 [Chitinophagaceae bacterium]MBK8605823.1 2-oxo acid dehydrogenase subunit E2 [Chitinophagaceae bacterium]MBP7109852.1 2-oxo acid dehydrogenase subunit E2 [Chitinophagaceae bacterium]HQV54197.1 dihydrolipoamide acetyltransferase family protein [Chitinophagaceae bacterium]HQX96854.1 dihydrolipoamide acetyltransferase family protein [Chitinophagaceae bacterium]